MQTSRLNLHVTQRVLTRPFFVTAVELLYFFLWQSETEQLAAAKWLVICCLNSERVLEKS